MYAPYDPDVVHLSKRSYWGLIRQAVNYFNIMWACRPEDEVQMVDKYDDARYVIVPQFYEGAWGKAYKRPCDLRRTRTMVLNMAHPYYKSRGPFAYVIRLLLSAFSGRDYCSTPPSETFDDWWLTNETGTCGRVNSVNDVESYIGDIPAVGSHLAKEPARFLRYAMSPHSVPATILVPLQNWQEDVIPWLAADFNDGTICLTHGGNLRVEISNGPLQHAIIMPGDPADQCY